MKGTNDTGNNQKGYIGTMDAQSHKGVPVNNACLNSLVESAIPYPYV